MGRRSAIRARAGGQRHQPVGGSCRQGPAPTMTPLDPLFAVAAAWTAQAPPNQPPQIVLERPPLALLRVGRPVALALVVSDPDGDAVTARLVRSPDLLGFAPIEN